MKQDRVLEVFCSVLNRSLMGPVAPGAQIKTVQGLGVPNSDRVNPNINLRRNSCAVSPVVSSDGSVRGFIVATAAHVRVIPGVLETRQLFKHTGLNSLQLVLALLENPEPERQSQGSFLMQKLC